MLLNYLDTLKEDYEIILASGSVNRRKILANCGLDYDKGDFKVSESGFKENLDKKQFESSRDYVVKNAEMKLEKKVEEVEAAGEG